MFKLLAKLNKALLPSFTKQGLDPIYAKKWQKQLYRLIRDGKASLLINYKIMFFNLLFYSKPVNTRIKRMLYT